MIAAAAPADGNAASSGASDAGRGTGAGGAGNGTGGGGTGEGSGGGSPARLIAGAIRDRDYPKDARRQQIQGSTTVRFTVGSDGRARGCTIARSSSSPLLDQATCRLIEARFRYAPARDAAGKPRAEQRGWRQDWWLEPRR